MLFKNVEETHTQHLNHDSSQINFRTSKRSVFCTCLFFYNFKCSGCHGNRKQLSAWWITFLLLGVHGCHCLARVSGNVLLLFDLWAIGYVDKLIIVFARSPGVLRWTEVIVKFVQLCQTLNLNWCRIDGGIRLSQLVRIFTCTPVTLDCFVTNSQRYYFYYKKSVKCSILCFVLTWCLKKNICKLFRDIFLALLSTSVKYCLHWIMLVCLKYKWKWLAFTSLPMNHCVLKFY